ncbi:MAG: hypothetical protein LBF51_07685, partial [Zoogloeaceae bacterium]|nr:hypothetical protein [Zoogloeaceae bacterium]
GSCVAQSGIPLEEEAGLLDFHVPTVPNRKQKSKPVDTLRFRDILPPMPQLAADLEAKREAAEARALEAEKTKALIGSKREATAMATASAEKRRAEGLEIELDRSKEYATVKRMQMLYHGQKFNWRLLKSTGVEMGIEPIEVFDQNYGTVKSYHADVWREAYALGIPG